MKWCFLVDRELYVLRGDHAPDADPAEIAEAAAAQWTEGGFGEDYDGRPHEFVLYLSDGDRSEEVGTFVVEVDWTPTFTARPR